MRWLAAVAATGLVMTGCSSNNDAGTNAADTPVVTPKHHEVVYAADGETTKTASYTLRTSDGGTRQGDFDIPLRNKEGGVGLTFTDFDSGDFVYLSIQNSEGYGSVTCQIIVDGVEVSRNTSDGGYKIASCQAQVP